MREQQMTTKAKAKVGAPSTFKQQWDAIEWPHIEAHVRRLQMRIAKAFREKRYGKAKALQWLLTHSYHAKLLATRRVTQNRGAKTPGVDKVTWKTPKQKMLAALSLKRRGYKSQPLKRIYIPKKEKGKLRPLSIPTMKCRAMQALHLLGLEPIAETIVDKNAYGFRPLRSTADASEQCCRVLYQKTSAQYILEADIHACFDNISHNWLLENVPMDKKVLKSWLKAGFIADDVRHSTKVGTPQGGVISPTLLNITLSGLEKAVHSVSKNPRKDRLYVVTYADDFIITGVTQKVLTDSVKPKVEAFLRERGLTLSERKTKITNINEGFDFLGANFRKYRGRLIRQPAKENVKAFLADIRKTIRENKMVKTENLIRLLNPKIRGWTNFHRHTCASQTFSYVSHLVFQTIWRWAKRRHPNKGRQWVKKKYFRSSGARNWIFNAKVKSKDGETIYLDLIDAGTVRIKRHIKIRAKATPYDPAYTEYFQKRAKRSWLASVKS